MPVQWVHLGAGTLLIASSRGAWIHPPGLDALAFGGPMPPTLEGTVVTTRHLLDGAIDAADLGMPERDAPLVTPLRWAWDLVNQWYVAAESIALLGEAVERFSADGRSDLATFTQTRLEGELGHEQFPIDDLRALGYDAEAAVRRVPPAATAGALIDYAARCVRGDQPIEFLGYVHSMERHVIRLTPEWFAELERVLPAGADATTGLRAHAGELDIDHVEEAIAFFAGLRADDRARIAIGCYRTALIRNRPTAIPEEAQIEAWLAPFQIQDQLK